MADTIFDNNAANTQRLIQASSGLQTFSYSQDSGLSLGPGDTDDYFKLTVSRSSNVIIKLYQDTGDANISLLDYTGDPNNLVSATTTNNSAGLSESIVTNTTLNPGDTYYIRVSANNPASTINYTLSVETIPDTRSDILWRNYNDGTDGIWRMNGSTIASSQFTGPAVDGSWRLETTGDLNGDGNTDYLWHNTINGTVGVWLMNSDGTVINSTVELPNVTSEWSVAGMGDFNGDGKLDLYWRNANTGDAGIWLMDGTTYTGVLDIDNIQDPSWRVQAVADFNGDKKPDLVFRNISTGETTIWLMNGNRFQSAVNLSNVETNWSIGGAGDFDGDGNTDLVWRNYATGDNGIWFMNKTTYQSAVSLPSVSPQSNYRIAGVITTGGTVDLAGNDASNAFSIGRLNGTANYTDAVGSNDPNDYYAFTLTSPAKVNASITGSGVSANAVLQIEKADGTVIVTETIVDGNTGKIADTQLDAGTYYARVLTTTGQKQDYSLTLGAVEQLPVNLFFPTPGQGGTPSIVLKDSNGNPITTSVSVKTAYPFQVSYNLEYTGRTLSDFKVAFVLSTDTTIDTSDYRLQVNGNNSLTISGADVLPDTVISRTTNLSLPSKDDPFWTQDGTYYIGIILDPDNEIEEKDQQNVPKENDNTISTAIKVIDARRPDLTSSNFNVIQASANRGDTIQLAGSITNIGNASSDTGNSTGSRFNVEFYLSKDNQFSNDDLLLNTGSFAPIAASGSVSFDANTPIVTDPGVPSLPAAYFDQAATLSSSWSGWLLGTTTQYYVIARINADASVKEITGGGTNNFITDTITISA